MSLFGLVFTILGAALLLSLLLWLYVWLYSRSINRHLHQPSDSSIHMPEPRHMLWVVLLILLLMVLLVVASFWPNMQRLTDAEDILADARMMGSVQEDWLAEVAVHEDIAGVLLYAPDKSDHTFAVYLNRGKRRGDYVFSHGGSSYSITAGLHSFHYLDGTILFGLDDYGIARVECGSTSFEIAADQPFALALPDNTFYLYDAEGQLLDEHQLDVYEKTQKQ